MVDQSTFRRASQIVGEESSRLLQERKDDGCWVDRLSSSSMATALGALALAGESGDDFPERVERACRWLLQNQRCDGGWAMADTQPPSSPGMTAFAVAALRKLKPLGWQKPVKRGEKFLDENDAEQVIPGLDGRAPKAWPAALPTIWALTGLRPFHDQPRFPIEFALLPRAVRERVSIGLPVIYALGAMQHRTLSSSQGPRKVAGGVATTKALAWIRRSMARNGGIEECPMIAAFLVLCLERGDLAPDIARASRHYLLQTQRADGSWAIDRDLKLSVTCYATMALDEVRPRPSAEFMAQTRDWIVGQQWLTPFPILNIPGGGWSWANPSGWPESEDTAVALEALHILGCEREHPAFGMGREWLESMQNRDGSWSEWVRNSNVMNDRPCPGVTSHVIMALARLEGPQLSEPRARALKYLKKAQQANGAASSVWFRDNVHGTSRLLEALVSSGMRGTEQAERARRFLLAQQGADGGWPRQRELPPEATTVEETAWALYALLTAGEDAGSPALVGAVRYLTERWSKDESWQPATVGLYFDDLCYTDDLIVRTFALRGLAKWLRAVKGEL